MQRLNRRRMALVGPHLNAGLFVCVFVRAAAVAAQLELMVSRYLEVILVGWCTLNRAALCSACFVPHRVPVRVICPFAV